MSKIRLPAVFFLLMSNLIIYGQNIGPFQIQLRESFQSSDKKPNPATFTYTHPKDGKESYLIDAALGLKLYGDPVMSLSFFGEFHKNTLVNKEQHAIQSGVALEWWTNKNFNTDDSEENSKTIILNFSGKYSNNIKDQIESMQLTGELTGLFTRLGRENCILPNANNNVGEILDFKYYPSIGFEAEGRFETKNDSTKGSIVRGVGKLNLNFVPLPILLKSSIEIFVDFAIRYDLLNSTKYSDYYHPWFEGGMNVVIFDDGKKSVKVNVSYTKGSNPAQGLKEQEFYSVSLKVKI